MRPATVDGCPFCAIVRGDAPATILRRTSEYVIFTDIAPQAPVHLLVIPTIHYEALSVMAVEASEKLIGKLVVAAAEWGRELASSGFRVLINEGAEGHQTVGHMHVHVLGGRQLGWPPG